MSEQRRLLVVGATGLTGSLAIRIGNEREMFRMMALARREFPIERGTRLEVLVADPKNWRQAVREMAPDAVLCAVGSTWHKSGRDEDAFRAVDYDLVLEIAHGAKEGEVNNFVLISSAGANKMSKNFYLRVKGETEDEVQKLRLPRLDILRPGLLLGKRTNDFRAGEGMARLFSPLADMVLRGARSELRSIKAETVAEAALQLASEKARGRFIHDNDAIQRAAKRFNYDHTVGQ